MKKRRKYIIDRKFQLKTTFAVIGFFLIVTAIIVLLIGINVIENNRKLEQTVKKMEDVVINQNHLLEALPNYSQIRSDRDYTIAKKVLSENINENISIMDSHITLISGITKRNIFLIPVLIILIFLQTFILYFIVMKKTHEISGPIYILTGHLKELLNGKYPEIRQLREKDEFKEMYDLFTRLVERMKESRINLREEK